jgi:hypothetical protein
MVMPTALRRGSGFRRGGFGQRRSGGANDPGMVNGMEGGGGAPATDGDKRQAASWGARHGGRPGRRATRRRSDGATSLAVVHGAEKSELGAARCARRGRRADGLWCRRRRGRDEEVTALRRGARDRGAQRLRRRGDGRSLTGSGGSARRQSGQPMRLRRRLRAAEWKVTRTVVASGAASVRLEEAASGAWAARGRRPWGRRLAGRICRRLDGARQSGSEEQR